MPPKLDTQPKEVSWQRYLDESQSAAKFCLILGMSPFDAREAARREVNTK